LPTGTGWQYEPKWDGFKCIAFKSGGDVDLRAKSGKPLGRYFPELIAFLAGLPVDRLRLSLSKSIRSLGRERRPDAVASYWKPRLTEGSIMTEKILRRGVKTPDAYEPDILRNVAVRQLVIPDNADAVAEYSINASDDAGVAAELMGQHKIDTLLVKEGEKVIGTVTSRALIDYYSRQRRKEVQYESPARTRRILVQGRKLLRHSKIMGI